jgi:uncharacterized protein YndB with AHSA1/START domain
MTTSVEVTLHEKEVDFMGATLERTFSVAVPVERAWKAMADPTELNQWYFPIEVGQDGSTSTEILGQARTSEVIAVEPRRMLKTRTTLTGNEGWGVQSGTREMTVVFEAIEKGTRITITHSGFGEHEDLTAVSRGLERRSPT